MEFRGGYTLARTFRDKVSVAWKLTLPALIFCLFFDIVAGVFLGRYFEKLMDEYPIILLVLPGLMGLRGNIYGAIASRFTSALYLGDIEPRIGDRKVLEIVTTGVVLSVMPVVILWFVGLAKLGLSGAFVTFAILMSSTIFVGFILGFTAASVTIFPFKRDLDPDAIATPVVTSVADLITIPSLILFLLLFEAQEIVFAATILVLVAVFLNMAFKFGVSKTTFFQLSGTLVVLALVSSVSGSILESYSGIIHQSLLFSVLYPSILDSLGNFGGIVGSRTSTRLHIGEVRGFFDGDMIKEILALITTFVPITVVMYSTGILIVYLMFQKVQKVFLPFFLLYPAAAFVVMLLAHFLAVAFYRFGLDPDNVTVPAITTLADLIGTLFTVAMAFAFVS